MSTMTASVVTISPRAADETPAHLARRIFLARYHYLAPQDTERADRRDATRLAEIEATLAAIDAAGLAVVEAEDGR